MEFIKFDVNQNVLCFGRCGITSNASIKRLIVEPKDTDSKITSFSFDRQIYQQRNIISVLSRNKETIDLILIFQNKEICVKVFEHIQKFKSISDKSYNKNDNDFFPQHLLPFLKSLSANELLKSKLGNIANKILQLLLPRVNDEILFNEMSKNDDIDGIIDLTENERLARKRKLPQKTAPLFNNPLNKNDSIIRNFEVKNFTKNGISKNRLIIFINSEKTLCYEYSWMEANKYYICLGCDISKPRTAVTARIFERRKEKSFVKCSKTAHVCQPRKYDFEKYNSDLVHSKQSYIKVKWHENGFIKDRIILFTSESKSHCYEFGQNGKLKHLKCIKCVTKKHQIMAKICINDNGEEYLTVSDKQHICEPIKYNPDIYETAPKIVKKPFFDFVKRRTKGSRIVEKLVLFDETDPSMCFEYKKYNAHYFCCYNCFKKDKNYCVSAKLIKDEKNGDYLELKQKEHICGLRKFIPEDLNSNIVFSDGFKTDEYRASDGDVKQRLIVFHPQDHTLCHIYHNIGNRGQDYWLCSGCLKLRQSKSARFNQKNPENPCVELTEKAHVCQLQPYIPSKIEPLKSPKILKKPDYIIENYVIPGGKTAKRLIIFDFNNRNLCYIYNFSSRGYFCCYPCGGTTAYVIAKLLKNEKNEEYIQLNDREHTCQPQPYIPELRSSIQIVKSPNFFFRPNPDDETIKTLVIYDPSNKEFCYQYTFWPRTKIYVCKKCRLLGKRITAKLCLNENGEEYLELNSDQHLCLLEPVENLPKMTEFERKKLSAAKSKLRQHHHRDLDYNIIDYEASEESEDSEEGEIEKIKRKPNLQELYNNDFKVKYYHKNGIKKSRLWIFPLTDKTKCYEYFWSNYYGCFLCCACEASKPKNYATAILLKKQNEEEYIEIGQNPHKCEIRKFDPKNFEKYQDCKIVKKPGWKLIKSKKDGTEKLVIFQESNPSFCYVYIRKKAKIPTYICKKCQNKTKGKNAYVTAKIIKDEKEEGEEFLELGITEHECKPQKYIPHLF